jgi:RNA polymerase sigma-70 factor (ECF subfamily)
LGASSDPKRSFPETEGLWTWPPVQGVREAMNGREALCLMESTQPDLVIMDVRMPEMDGLAATRLIKTRWPSVRVVVLSMYGEYVDEALAAGADAFVTKGEPPNQLLARLEAVATRFSDLMGAYQTAVYNLCYRMLGEAREAEDATQEAFLRAFTQLHRYDPTRPFKTWLFSIACHHCIDRLRKRRLTWVDIDDEPLSSHPALREPRPGPEESVIKGEQSAAIQALLASLSPKDRGAIVMRYWFDLSYEEIARVTGTSASAVKSRLHRARTALGKTMGSTRSGRLRAQTAGPRRELAYSAWAFS